MAVLDITFPEYDEVFFDLFAVTSTEILKRYSSPEEIAKLDITKLTKVLEQLSRNQLRQSKAEELKQKAEDSFGLKFGIDAFSLELKCLMEQIEHLRKQLTLLEKEIKVLVLKENKALLTIPRVSFISAGIILGETVDFHGKEGSDPRSLLAFAGLDPKLNKSGNFMGQTRMSKRGSRYLREAIWYSAQSASVHSLEFRSIYERHKGKGKHHDVAVSHVAKKLTYVIYSVLKTGKEYYPVG